MKHNEAPQGEGKKMLITGLADENAEYAFDENGNPRENEFGNAISIWLMCQDRESVTVAEAMMAFNATEEIIKQVVDNHPWMILFGDKIVSEGE